MKQRLCRSLVFLAASSLLAFGAQAGNSTGMVALTYVVNASTSTPDRSVFILKNAPSITGTPACNTVQEYAVRLNTPAGKSIQQQVNLAIALGKPVTVVGDGTCSAWDDRETIIYVYVGW